MGEALIFPSSKLLVTSAVPKEFDEAFEEALGRGKLERMNPEGLLLFFSKSRRLGNRATKCKAKTK